MKQKIMLTISTLLPMMAIASQPEAMLVPEFSGGLDINKVVACENKYKESCPLGKGRSIGQRLAQQSACTVKKMAYDTSCRQASRIRQLSTEPPTKLRKYGDIAVFDVTSLSDGAENFYMVDKKGMFIALTTHLNLESTPEFLRLRQKHKTVSLTGYLHMIRSGQNLFPNAYTLPNKNHRLVFKQELRKDYFAPASTVGVADVAYDFDANGKYLGATLLKIQEV